MDTPIYIRTLPNTARVTSALYLSESFDTAHSQYYSNEGTTTMDTHLVYVYSPRKRVTNNALNTNKCVIFVHNRPFRVYDIFRVSAFFFCLERRRRRRRRRDHKNTKSFTSKTHDHQRFATSRDQQKTKKKKKKKKKKTEKKKKGLSLPSEDDDVIFFRVVVVF